MHMAKESGIFAAVMPSVFGYGLLHFSLNSEEEAKAQLRSAYLSSAVFLKEAGSLSEAERLFPKRWEYYGGYTLELDMNKSYDEQLR